MARVRVFLAVSVDGFIAGPDDDLSWLPTEDQPGPGAIDFTAFLADVGSMLMGRRTYDVVAGFDSPWAYGEIPVLVPTHRPLEPVVPTVEAVSGPIDALIDTALHRAGGKDVYVDGGALVRAALAADRVDELILTTVPVLLGGGIPLFDTLPRRVPLELAPPTLYGSMVQLRATVMRS